MPPRGKCWSCGEITFLSPEILENKETGKWYCMMVCRRCKRFYESGGIETNDEIPETTKTLKGEK